jgi:raffinose/stachyose/melibiose transport system substrate-binding protein
MFRRYTRSGLGAAVLLAAALAGCGTGASNGAGSAAAGSSSATTAGKLTGTLQEWNWDTVGDNPAAYAIMPATIKDFEKRYANTNVQNTSMSLEEQTDKLPLALASASSTPTVTQVNEGYSSMGRLVTDNELLPLNSYSKKYNWLATVGEPSLQVNSFTADGKNFGSGNLYAVPSTADEMGIFYNKKLLSEVGGEAPTSWASFTRDMSLAHQHGMTAMAFGSGQPTDYNPVNVFDMIANQYVPPAQGIAWVFHLGKNPSIDTPGYVKAAETLRSWATSGYLSNGFSGVSSAAAINQFAAGKATFLIEGNWEASAFGHLGKNVGFWVPGVVTGGPDEGWAIPTHSPNPALGVAWINEQLTPSIQVAQLAHGNIPVVKPSAAALAKVSTLMQQSVAGWFHASTKNHVVPFLADAPPSSFLNTQMAGVQQLLGGQSSPSAVLSGWQSGYEKYWSK